ncbi:methyltransferase domain-containing protein, partial [Acinetobacter baumannii]
YDPSYVMGRSTAETDRLKRQSQLYDASTWQLLREAGLAPGMKVLDVGSGAGNVSFVAASLVGEGGKVVGVDSNPAIV